MKVQNKTIKSNLLKKLFIKVCRIFDFEIIDQANLHLPVINKKISQRSVNYRKAINCYANGSTKDNTSSQISRHYLKNLRFCKYAFSIEKKNF